MSARDDVREERQRRAAMVICVGGGRDAGHSLRASRAVSSLGRGCSWSSVVPPLDWRELGDHAYPAHDAEQADAGGGDECEREMTGAQHDEPGEPGRDLSREVAERILDTHPAP